jgi:hypothetical protein
MTKPSSAEAQFCIRCHTWGSSDLMQPLYRFPDPEAGPCLWLHHHCAEIYSSTQFEAAMKRFESQIHAVAGSQTGNAVVDLAKVRVQLNLAAAAERAARSLHDLKRAKAALTEAGMAGEDMPRT